MPMTRRINHKCPNWVENSTVPGASELMHSIKSSPLIDAAMSQSLAAIPNSPAKVSGPSLGHDSAVINAGLTVQWTPHLSTYLSYDGQLGRSRYNSNGVSGGFRYAF
jgi:outer membrane autotransporter protein